MAISGCGSSSNHTTCGGGCPTNVPAVTSSSPAGGATGVAVSTAPTATFDMPMDASTLTSSTFTLSSSSGAVTGTVSYSSSNFTATFTPSSALAYNTQYTATITTGAKSTAGGYVSAPYTWSFTTQAAPAPTVMSTSPASGAANVAVGTTVTATFSTAMNASTITASTFTLSGSGGAVTGTVSYDSAGNTATFTPSAPLAYNTQYTATITTAAQDSAGTGLAANETWNFTTVAAPAPTVTAEAPASGAANVDIGASVTATFSEAMQASTLTSSTFTLASSGGAVSGSVAYDAGSDTATFTPSSSLSYATTYTATITTGATASNGATLATGFTWQFTTEAAPAAPQVTSTTPASGATSVAINTVVTAVFNQAMNPSSISATSFTLKAQGGGSVAGSVTYSAANQAATFTPSANLSYGTTYTATLTTSITSASGQALAANYTWSFATPAAPTVLSTTPANGATSVAATTDVTATFSMAMNAATLTTGTFTLSGGGGPVAGMVSYAAASDTATFTPSASLAYNTVYTATITTGAQNPGGVGLASNYQWSFTTEAAPSGMVTVDYGPSGQDQIIRGFGGSTAWLGQLTTAQANALFSPSTGLGLSILRVRIDPTGTAANNWVPTNGNWLQEVNNANEAVAANPNAIVFASPWTPPPSMKTSSSSQPYYSGTSPCSPGTGYCGGYLDPSNYAAYASYLNSFIAYFDANSTNPLYAISMQNEPDWSAQPSENYESCSWTAAQMQSWIDAEGSTLQAPLIMPESLDFNPAQASPSLSDPTAVADISIVAGHLYGASPSYYTQAKNAGKDVWMTEHYLSPSGSSPAMSDALAAAEEIHNAMVTGQYNAYVWWWIWDQASYINYGLLNSSSSNPQPTYYGYAIGQFSRFVQPGYYRYNATANPSSNVLVSAYAGNGHYIIVAINSGTNSVSQPFTIQNATVTSMNVWQTTASGGLVQQPSPVTVSGSQFTYTLPAQSITTFVTP